MWQSVNFNESMNQIGLCIFILIEYNGFVFLHLNGLKMWFTVYTVNQKITNWTEVFLGCLVMGFTNQCIVHC